MDVLRQVYESIGLKNPQTYLQSGNVLFATKERDVGRLVRHRLSIPRLECAVNGDSVQSRLFVPERFHGVDA